MSGSRIVEVRNYVVEGLAGLPAFRDVEVLFAYNGTTSARFAYTREAQFDHDPAVMSSARTVRKEEGQFKLVIWCQVTGVTPQEACDQALTLGQAAEEWVADHRTPDLDGVDWLLVQGPGSLSEVAGDQVALAELTYTIAYRARLT